MVTYDPRESADDDAVTASDAAGSEASSEAVGSEATSETAGEIAGAESPSEAASAEGGMSDRAQWLVVATLAVCGLGAPAYLYWVGPGSFGLGFRDTYLAIPMIPALLLGAVGVWTAVRGR